MKYVLSAVLDSGEKVYATLVGKMAQISTTQSKSDAVTFDQRDNMNIKKMYYTTFTGINFQVEQI